MKFERQVHFQRFMLGIICGLLPAACLLFGMPGMFRGVNFPWWYNSISATYYANSKSCMIIALGLCAFFLFTYKGYDLGDRLFTSVAAVAALGVVFFPVNTEGAGDYVGLLAVPLGLSNALHSVSAAVLFGSFALMTLTQFPKGRQARKNRLYRVCGVMMLVAMAGIPGGHFLGLPGYTTMVCEAVLLEAFSVAWIAKSGICVKG